MNTQKTQRGLLYAIRACFVVMALLFFVLILVDPNYNKWGGVFAGIGLPFLTPLIEKVFKSKIPFRIQLFYYIFLFVALDLGICLDWYKTVPYFDKVVHFGSGILSTLVGYYAIPYFKAENTPRAFRIMFVVFTSITIAVAWECFEFGCDKLLGQHMQELVKAGVDDTMYDLLCATIGSIIGAFVLVRPNPSKKAKKH
jgi:uncharacterized membrane protein YjdF